MHKNNNLHMQKKSTFLRIFILIEYCEVKTIILLFVKNGNSITKNKGSYHNDKYTKALIKLAPS